MQFSIAPLSPALGAEVHGLDLRQRPDETTVERLLEAWHEHLVLLFSGQNITEEEQFRFAESFGPVGERRREAEKRPEGPDADRIMLITNIRRNGVPIGSLPDGEMFFHHDMCYVEAPHIATLLYAIEVPAKGGNTVFANMHKAYDTLSAELKEKIAGRKAVQVYNYLPTVRVDPDDGFDDYHHYIQPTVIRHPATGRKALYINELMTVPIEGLPAEESESTLASIREHIARPEHVYEHSWTPGDLLMWDNRCTCHARTDFPPDQTRLLRRCTVAGGAPLIPA